MKYVLNLKHNSRSKKKLLNNYVLHMKIIACNNIKIEISVFSGIFINF